MYTGFDGHTIVAGVANVHERVRDVHSYANYTLFYLPEKKQYLSDDHNNTKNTSRDVVATHIQYLWDISDSLCLTTATGHAVHILSPGNQVAGLIR